MYIFIYIYIWAVQIKSLEHLQSLGPKFWAQRWRETYEVSAGQFVVNNPPDRSLGSDFTVLACARTHLSRINSEHVCFKARWAHL